MNKLFIIVTVLCFCILKTTGQTPVLVKDIKPGSGLGYPDNEANGAVANGYYYFTGDDGVHGTELWKSDGTEVGTTMVKDINPGATGSNPAPYYPLGDKVLFFANDGIHGEELWVSDGTEIGTGLLMDMNPGSANAVIKGIMTSFKNTAVTSGHFYFPATDGIHKHQIYKSDGTSLGTSLVGNVCCDSIPNTSVISYMIAFQEKVYFNLRGIWVSDGTESGTYRYTTTDIGGNQIGLIRPAVVGDKIYFTSSGRIYTTDGTASGTLQVLPDSLGIVSDFQGLGDKVYFRADTSLYRTDGTASGTEFVIGITPKWTIFDEDPNMYVWNNELYFQREVANDTTFLYKVDGATENIAKVMTVHDSPLYDFGSLFYQSTNDYLFFDPVDLFSDVPAIGRIDKQGNVDVFPVGPSVLYLNILNDNLLFKGLVTNTIGSELYKIPLTFVQAIEPTPKSDIVSIKPTISANGQFCFYLNNETYETFDVEVLDALGRVITQSKSLMTGDCINPESATGVLFARIRVAGNQEFIKKLVRI